MYENLYAAASGMGQGAPAGKHADPTGGARLDAAIIGERVRQARFAARLTQQELAGDRYSKSYISAVERGKMTPSLQALGWLAERLGQPMSFFLGENTGDLSGLAGASGPTDHERQQREEKARQMLDKAELRMTQNNPKEALAALDSEDHEPPPDLPLEEQARWYWLSGWAATQLRQFPGAMRWLERGLEVMERLRAEPSLSQSASLAQMEVRMRDLLGGCYYEQEQPEKALKSHLPSLVAISDGTVTDSGLQLRIFKSLGNDYLALGHHDAAIQMFKRAKELAGDLNDPRQQGLALWGLGLTYKANGDPFHAKVNFQEAITIFEELQDAPLVARLRSMLADVLIELREYEEAEILLHLSLKAAEQKDNALARRVVLGNLARLHLAKGNLDEAIKYAQEGIKAVESGEDRRTEGQIYLTLAETYEARHDIPAAERAYKEAIAMLGQGQDGVFIGRAHERYGRFLAAQGRLQEAYQEMQLSWAVVNRRSSGQ